MGQTACSIPGLLHTITHLLIAACLFNLFSSQGYYFSGDGARRDKDGYYWITGALCCAVLCCACSGPLWRCTPAPAHATLHPPPSRMRCSITSPPSHATLLPPSGRVDDVINVSGHRIGTAEVESALVAHPQCAEAAVVGYEHPVKGQGIWAYVTLLEVSRQAARRCTDLFCCGVQGQFRGMYRLLRHRAQDCKLAGCVRVWWHRGQPTAWGHHHTCSHALLPTLLYCPQGVEYDDKLKKELVMSVREQIGAFAAPDVIHWAPGLPKTRSGKIMRRGEWPALEGVL